MKIRKYKIESGVFTINEIAEKFGLSYGAAFHRINDHNAYLDKDFSNKFKGEKYFIDGDWFSVLEICERASVSKNTVYIRLRMGVKKFADFKCPKKDLLKRFQCLKDKNIKKKEYNRTTTMGDPMWNFWMKVLR